MIREFNAILAISQRDLIKLLRDPPRILSTFIFPFLFIGALGGSLDANLGTGLGYDYFPFIFTGVFGQTLFMSTAQGIISLIEDRETDFSQEIFVSPISRYSIVVGKILGETLVALPQGIGIVLFSLLIGIQISVSQIIALIPVSILVCLFGGAFGLVILSNLASQRAAQQVFPFIMLPQFFLAGVFNPIRVLPSYLDVISKVSPMRYAVDLVRGAFYAGEPEYNATVLAAPLSNLAVMGAMSAGFLVLGTYLFIRRERDR